MFKKIYSPDARSATIAAIVALVVAAPLSDAAHHGAASAVRVVKGKQGKRGKTGPTGAVGPRGPQGAPGPRSQSPQRGFAEVAPGEVRTLIADCHEWGQSPSGGDVDIAPWSPWGGSVTILRDGTGHMDWSPQQSYFAIVRNDSNNLVIASASADCG